MLVEQFGGLMMERSPGEARSCEAIPDTGESVTTIFQLCVPVRNVCSRPRSLISRLPLKMCPLAVLRTYEARDADYRRVTHRMRTQIAFAFVFTMINRPRVPSASITDSRDV